MLYSVLIYETEEQDERLSETEKAKRMQQHSDFQSALKKEGQLNTVVRLMPRKTARTIQGSEELMITDGPFADTKEQFVGFYLIEAETTEDVMEKCKLLPRHAALEIRPVRYFEGGDIEGGKPTIIRHP